jgi:hypothetical protein
MPRTWRTTAYLAIVLTVSVCGCSTTAPSTTTATPHGEVSDPVGDAIADSRVPVSPDLVHATADVQAGNITFVVQFASGTFDRPTTRVSMVLDTDQNASTGILQLDGVGADYGIDLDASTSQAAVTKADPVGCAAHSSCFSPITLAPITFVTNGVQVTLPLSLLGNSDGRMTFQLHSYVLVAGAAVVVDFMPDSTLPPGRVQ